MKDKLIRVDSDLYEVIKNEADINNRTIKGQLKTIIEKELKNDGVKPDEQEGNK